MVVTVEPVPIADFKFLVSDGSSKDGLQVVCIDSTIQFRDLSSVDAPSLITSWEWNFGDGEIAETKNPNHQYNQTELFHV